MNQNKKHWSEQKEQAGYFQMKLMIFLSKIFPPVFLRLCAFPVGFFYFVFSRKQRRQAAEFLKKISDVQGIKKLSVLKLFFSFSLTVVEKLESWNGKIEFSKIHFQNDDIADLVNRLENKRGALLICSHLGNAELLRALASFDRTGVSGTVPVVSIVDFSVTAYFNKMIKEINPKADMKVFSANDIGPDTIIVLQETVAAGGLVVIAGDRTSANSPSRNIPVEFMGEEAEFPLGVFVLASLLEVPVYFVFALRAPDLSIKAEYNMHVIRSKTNFDIPKKERDSARISALKEFVYYLEKYCKKAPLQWYNFYDFWNVTDSEHQNRSCINGK